MTETKNEQQLNSFKRKLGNTSYQIERKAPGFSHGDISEWQPNNKHMFDFLLSLYYIKQIKSRSSRFFRQEFPWLKSRLPTLWTNRYSVSTAGDAPLTVIKQ